jgi:hypothetical protein
MNSAHRMTFLIILTLGTVSSNLMAQAAGPDSSKKVSKLHQSLVGAWAMAGRPGTTVEPKPGAQLKFWGLRHFAVTKRNTATGKLDYHHVGTYTLDGDQYTETVMFAFGATEHLVGRTFKFRIQIDGDTYIQHGIGNPWTEQWKRQVAVETGKAAETEESKVDGRTEVLN